MSRPRGTTEAALIAAAGRVGCSWAAFALARLQLLCDEKVPTVETIATALRVTPRHARRIRRVFGLPPMVLTKPRKPRCELCGQRGHHARKCEEEQRRTREAVMKLGREALESWTNVMAGKS
jgi:hypothetical protein